MGSTTIKPGEKTTLSFETHMMTGMDGPHLFEITVPTNDPLQPAQKLRVKAVFG